jgi:exonuclease VII small subunit
MFASKYDDAQAFQHLEQVIMQLPHAKEQLEERMEQFKEARARWEATKILGIEAQWDYSG